MNIQTKHMNIYYGKYSEHIYISLYFLVRIQVGFLQKYILILHFFLFIAFCLCVDCIFFYCIVSVYLVLKLD